MYSETKLASLKEGQSATVRELSAEGALRRRLQDIGLIQGTRVECIGASPLGDPCAYLIRGAVIALRGEDAAFILVEDPHSAPVKARGTAYAKRAGGMVAE